MLDIIQGEQQPWAFQVTTKNKSTGKTRPLDLTGFEEITVCFKTESTVITKLESTGDVTVDDLIFGEISGFLEVAETNGMAATEDGSVEVAVDFGGGVVKKSIITQSHRVTEKICAT